MVFGHVEVKTGDAVIGISDMNTNASELDAAVVVGNQSGSFWAFANISF